MVLHTLWHNTWNLCPKLLCWFLFFPPLSVISCILRIDMIPEKNFAYLEYAVSSKYLTTIHKEKLYSLITHKCNFGEVQWLKKTIFSLTVLIIYLVLAFYRSDHIINLKTATKRFNMYEWVYVHVYMFVTMYIHRYKDQLKNFSHKFLLWPIYFWANTTEISYSLLVFP